MFQLCFCSAADEGYKRQRTKGAATAMLTIAQLDTPLKSASVWWLMNRMNNDWKEHDLLPELKARGIYDPSKVVVQEVMTPAPDEAQKSALTVEVVLALKGDAARGKATSARCIMCHEIGGVGVQFGPPLDGWGRTQTDEVIARSLIDPSADIAHGFDGSVLLTKEGKTDHGRVIQEGNPTIITSMCELTQIVLSKEIALNQKLNRPLMHSAP